jgi:hypothetical protein
MLALAALIIPVMAIQIHTAEAKAIEFKAYYLYVSYKTCGRLINRWWIIKIISF